MTKGCTISVIVPVYNAAEYLETCVESLRGQTFTDLEILLVDDGSTDESGKLCDRLAQEDARIRALHTENAGVSAARNRGIEEAKGECLSFVDADDWIAPDMLEYLLNLMNRTGADVAGCGFKECAERSKRREKQAEAEILPCQWDGRDTQEDTAGSVTLLRGEKFTGQGLLCGDTRCWSKLYKRESIGTERFDTGFTIGEDMLFLLALAQKGAVFASGRYAGYFYFLNDAGAMNRPFKDSYMDQIACWREALDRIRPVSPQYTAKAASLLMTAVMLTAGKLSLLSPREWKTKAKRRQLQTCREQLKEGMKARGAFGLLDPDYRIKICLFYLTPTGYLRLYHCLKGKGV